MILERLKNNPVLVTSIGETYINTRVCLKFDLSYCVRYKRVSGGGWKGRMFGVEGLSIKIHRCMSAMGHISLILPYLRQLKGK